MQKLVPNIKDGHEDVIKIRNHGRRGRICEPARISLRGPAKIVTLRQNSFVYKAPKLFNSLPNKLRDKDVSVNTFKNYLDNFLSTIPDEPQISGYVSRAPSNFLVDQLQLMKADKMF